ncbi:MAG: hypothetical protein DRI40_01625 [Chloroflexi bacterium]|nr:MAG: hypothetical protein DRI40_01625 [Chloroflexota bacterium]
MTFVSTLGRKTVTLDISSRAIRLLLMSAKRVEKFASAPLEPGLIEDGLITDPLALGTKVKGLMRSSGISGNRVVASVNGTYSVYRVLNLSEEAREPQDEKVLDMAVSAMPVAAEQLYISYQVMPDGQGRQTAFVVGLPRDIVDAEVQGLRAVGVNPYILNLKGLALWKLVQLGHGVIVNMEADSLDVVLMAGGFPQVIRTVPVQDNCDLEDRIDRVVRILRQTDGVYGSRQVRRKAEVDTPLVLAGPLADDPAVVGALRRVAQYAILPLLVPVEYPVSMPVSHYAVNIGLALRQGASPCGDVKTYA